MKKYFRIKIADGDPRVCDPTMDSENWINESLYANEYKEIHELPIRYVVNNKYEPIDLIYNSNILVSNKAFNIIKKLCKNITGFESQMYLNGEKIWDIYYTIVCPRYKIFNWEKSSYITKKSIATGEMYIKEINKLVFDSKKIQNINEDNFFTMDEKPTRIYCTELGKQAIEEAGLIGFAFEEIPVE